MLRRRPGGGAEVRKHRVNLQRLWCPHIGFQEGRRLAAGRLAMPSCPGDPGAPRRLPEAGNVGPGGSGCRKGAPGSNTWSGQDRSGAKASSEPSPRGGGPLGPGAG